MSVKSERLGGRLSLLDPRALSIAQKEIYDRLNTTMIPWADGAHFKSKTDGGRLIGPFNPILLSPHISARFLDLHDGEEKHTSLSERVRQVGILAVGAVGTRTTSFMLIGRQPETPVFQRTQSERWRSVDYQMTLATRRRSR